MIRIAICDDEKILLESAYNKIKSIVDKSEKNCVIEIYQDGRKMLSDMEKAICNFDIIFLDIEMPIISGFELAELIRKYNENIIVIFLTSMEHLVYESLKYRPFRFVRKHRMNEELPEVLKAAITLLEKNEKYQYFFKTDDGEIKLSISDILYIECLNRKVYLKTHHKKYMISGLQFNNITKEFLDKGFVSIHRSCIVNLKYIYSIEKLVVRMDNDEVLPMSRHKTNEVKRAFTLYAE